MIHGSCDLAELFNSTEFTDLIDGNHVRLMIYNDFVAIIFIITAILTFRLVNFMILTIL